MTASATAARTAEDQAMIAELLNGADPDSYVVAPLGDLVWLVQAAVQSELRARRQMSPSRVAFRVARSLASDHRLEQVRS